MSLVTHQTLFMPCEYISVLPADNSDLHFKVGEDGMSGQPLLWEKFPLLWSGCRLSHGVQYGKVIFEVKVCLCGTVKMKVLSRWYSLYKVLGSSMMSLCLMLLWPFMSNGLCAPMHSMWKGCCLVFWRRGWTLNPMP